MTEFHGYGFRQHRRQRRPSRGERETAVLISRMMRIVLLKQALFLSLRLPLFLNNLLCEQLLRRFLTS